MKKSYLLFVWVTIMFFSCGKEDEEPYPPSVIEFELQYFPPTPPGSVFTGKQTLSKKTYAYQADGENNLSGGVLTQPNGNTYLIIAGNGNNCHPSVNYFSLKLPDRGEGNYIGNYDFDPDTSEQKDFEFSIETTYDSKLIGANNRFGGFQTKFHADITEYTDEHIKGSFTGDLVYYNVEEINHVTHNTLDEEISFVNKPIINGTFDIYLAN